MYLEGLCRFIIPDVLLYEAKHHTVETMRRTSGHHCIFCQRLIPWSLPSSLISYNQVVMA